MCPKYVILVVLNFGLHYMTLNYFDILFGDSSLSSLSLFSLLCSVLYYKVDTPGPSLAF